MESLEMLISKGAKGCIFVLFLIGLFSFSLLLLYMLAGFMFIFGNTPYPGDIAFLPKKFFLLTSFLIFGKLNFVKEMMIHLFDI